MKSNCTFPGHFAPLTYYDLHCHEYVTTSCVPPKHTVSIINVGFQISIWHEDSFQKVIKLRRFGCHHLCSTQYVLVHRISSVGSV